MSIPTDFFVSHELHKKLGKIENRLNEVAKDFIEIWKEDIFLSSSWWLSLALSVIPWLLWAKYRNKESASRLLFAGFFIIIISSWLDFFGAQLGFWYYPSKLFPLQPPYFPYDFCILPVIAMFFMQYKTQIPAWIKAIVYSVINCFIGEPILWAIHFYEPVDWKFYYSFPIYVLIYLVGDWLSKRKSFAELKG